MAHEGKRHGFAASGNSKIYNNSVSKVVKKNYDNLLNQEKSNHWSNTSGQGSVTSSMNHADAIRMNKLNEERINASNGKDNDASDISILGNDKVTFAGVNDQHYDDNNVPKMSLVPDVTLNSNSDNSSKVGAVIINNNYLDGVSGESDIHTHWGNSVGPMSPLERARIR